MVGKSKGDNKPVEPDVLGNVRWTDGRPLSRDNPRIAQRLREEGRTQANILSGPRFGAAKGPQVCDMQSRR